MFDKKIILNNTQIPLEYSNNIQWLNLPNMNPLWLLHVNNVEQWVEDDGEYTHRFDYNLTKDSIIFDVGGYLGEWSATMYARYNCNIHIFEPCLKYFQRLEKIFKGNNKFNLHNIALDSQTGDFKLSNSGDGSSIYISTDEYEIIRSVNIVEWFDANDIGTIDILKLNIEGSEYDLLDTLLSSKYIKNIKNIQVQFHWWIPNAEFRMNSIREKLKNTHQLTYQYDFVWENWTLK